MPQPFRFKQFSVHDDCCGQKVGTDSILLGSWAFANHVTNVLDIGTGCGLLTLMLAQRFSNASITAIEIDQSAYQQVRQNFFTSPWAHRLTAIHADARKFTPATSFDLIVCNPPYFESSLKPADDCRATARHNQQLTFQELSEISAALLNQQGRFCVVLPFDRAAEFMDIAKCFDLHLIRRCDVRPIPAAKFKRSLLEFGCQIPTSVEVDELVLEESRHQYSDGYIALAKDFLLKM